MTAALIDALASLAQIVDEENDRLTRPIHHPELPALVEAKTRLAATVEVEIARLARERPDWINSVEGEGRAALTQAVEVLTRRLAVNSKLIERRIELCDEIMEAVADEARRLSGARSAVYGVHGTLSRSDQAAPIAVNSRI